MKTVLQEWSPRWRPLRWRATLIGLVIAALVIPLAFLSLPYLEWFNDMAVQPKGKTQGQYGWFSGKQLPVERLPVAGTVPMGFTPYTIEGKDEASAKRAEATLVNPLKPTRDVLDRGRQVFDNICWTCHGRRGDADGPIIGPGLFPAPPSLHTKQARAFKDGRIFHIITRGQNKMPAYADLVEPHERWAVVHYIRALQRAKQMSTGGR